ncbi:MAG: hypothetical protein AAF399_26980, partial [Bacteroidota bacterium]
MYQVFIRKWIVAMAVAWLPVLGIASILPVQNTQDQGLGSLRATIESATESDTLDLRGLSGQIELDSVLIIDKSLHLLGSGAGELKLDGKGESRI